MSASAAAQRFVPLAGDGLAVRSFADIKPEPIQWLWPGRIARGKLTVLAGHPGLGKSQLSLAIAATESTAGFWPCGDGKGSGGSTLILSAEDDAADTIRPRLEAAGADLSRTHIVDAVRDKDDDGRARLRGFSLDRDLDRLDRTLAEMSAVSLVVIDPLTAYLDGIDSHKNAEVRSALGPLSELAARHGVAVLAISHLRKAGGDQAILRVAGSLAFVAAARAAFAVCADQADPSRRLLLPLKNNIGDDKSGYAFRVESATVTAGIATSRLDWEPGRVTVTADEAMGDGAGGDVSVLDSAQDFLGDLLADGPVAVTVIKTEAEAAGISWATVRRGKDAVGVVARKDGLSGGWTWQLPPKVLNRPEGAQDSDVSTLSTLSTLSTFNQLEPVPAAGGIEVDL